MQQYSKTNISFKKQQKPKPTPFPDRDKVTKNFDYKTIISLLNTQDYKYLLSPLLTLTEKFYENSKSKKYILYDDIKNLRNDLSHYNINIQQKTTTINQYTTQITQEVTTNPNPYKKLNQEAQDSLTILKQHTDNNFITLFLYLTDYIPYEFIKITLDKFIAELEAKHSLLKLYNHSTKTKEELKETLYNINILKLILFISKSYIKKHNTYISLSSRYKKSNNSKDDYYKFIYIYKQDDNNELFNFKINFYIHKSYIGNFPFIKNKYDNNYYIDTQINLEKNLEDSLKKYLNIKLFSINTYDLIKYIFKKDPEQIKNYKPQKNDHPNKSTKINYQLYKNSDKCWQIYDSLSNSKTIKNKFMKKFNIRCNNTIKQEIIFNSNYEKQIKEYIIQKLKLNEFYLSKRILGKNSDINKQKITDKKYIKKHDDAFFDLCTKDAQEISFNENQDINISNNIIKLNNIFKYSCEDSFIYKKYQFNIQKPVQIDKLFQYEIISIDNTDLKILFQNYIQEFNKSKDIQFLMFLHSLGNGDKSKSETIDSILTATLKYHDIKDYIKKDYIKKFLPNEEKKEKENIITDCIYYFYTGTDIIVDKDITATSSAIIPQQIHLKANDSQKNKNTDTIYYFQNILKEGKLNNKPKPIILIPISFLKKYIFQIIKNNYTQASRVIQQINHFEKEFFTNNTNLFKDKDNQNIPYCDFLHANLKSEYSKIFTQDFIQELKKIRNAALHFNEPKSKNFDIQKLNSVLTLLPEEEQKTILQNLIKAIKNYTTL